MMTLDPAAIPGTRLHQILLGSIAPRPIALVSTIDETGTPNLSPFSFFNAFGVNPSTLIFSPNRRNRDASVKHTYLNIKAIPEAVINIVTYDIVQQVSLASTEYPAGINEFLKSGLTALPSESIRPFRVAESPVQFECIVRQVVETGTGPGAANLIICEITRVHLKEDILDEKGMIIPGKARLVGRMGGDYYVKAFDDALFKVAKPVERLGIGIDALPEPIRTSKRLTGNQLGKLGNIQHLPTAEEIDASEAPSLLTSLRNSFPDPEEYQEQLHTTVSQLLDNEQVHLAICLLLRS